MTRNVRCAVRTAIGNIPGRLTLGKNAVWVENDGDTDTAERGIAITNYGQCGETHDTATLHNLGHAINRNHLFDETITTIFRLLHFSLCLSHHLPQVKTSSHARAQLQPAP